MSYTTMWFVREDLDKDGNVTDRIPFPGNNIPVSSSNARFRECTPQEAVELDKARTKRPIPGYAIVPLDEKKRRLAEDTAAALANIAEPFDLDAPVPSETLRQENDALAHQVEDALAALQRENEALRLALEKKNVRPVRLAKFENQGHFPSKTSLVEYAEQFYPDAGITAEVSRAEMVEALDALQDAEFGARETVGVT
jgi:hypothetical protein